MDQLAALLDREAVMAVCTRYAVSLDTRDWERLRTCFTPDAVGEYAGIGTLNGVDEFEQICRTALEPLAVSQHLLGNFEIDVDGDEARASCYFHAQHVKPGTPGGDQFIVAGTYTDRQVRTPDGWRIAHRRLDVAWTSGNPAVLAR